MNHSILSTPDLLEQDILGFAAGLRPYREKGMRIEAEQIDGKWIVHNYGHGGAGVTMSLGSAKEVCRIIENRIQSTHTVAVLGAGVIGLTTARALASLGHQVTVYSNHFTPNTTSDVAGAQWCPTYVAAGQNREQFDRVLRESFVLFEALIGASFGVTRKSNYVQQDRENYFREIPVGILPAPAELSRLPWEHTDFGGFRYETLFIDPPIFMPRLTQECNELGVQFQTRSFGCRADVFALQQPVIVNCLGAGAGKVFDDSSVVPVKGQLVLLQPQSIDWLLTHQTGYVFPRQSALLLGGSFERDFVDSEPDEETCRSILKANQTFFARKND